MRWPKYWSFSFSIIPSKEIPGLIFRMHWLDLFAVQGTLKSLLQHHSSKASILRHSAFFTVHLPHPYMTTGKTIALTRRTFVGKVMSLLWYFVTIDKVWVQKSVYRNVPICLYSQGFTMEIWALFPTNSVHIEILISIKLLPLLGERSKGPVSKERNNIPVWRR